MVDENILEGSKSPMMEEESLFIEKDFLSLDLRCTHPAMKRATVPLHQPVKSVFYHKHTKKNCYNYIVISQHIYTSFEILL